MSAVRRALSGQSRPEVPKPEVPKPEVSEPRPRTPQAPTGPSGSARERWRPGRPFRVGLQQRLAAAALREDWQAAASDARPLTPSERARRPLTHAWLRAGLAEHASVAAFARFTLQLLHLGAPAQLVADAGRALRDEIHHAELCFSLASRFAGHGLGPDTLDTDGALSDVAPAAVIESAIFEGCVGETLAAFEASEALSHCEDEAAASALATIQRDEARHAELAWRFVGWALQQLPEAWVRPAAERAFARAARQLRASPGSQRHEGELERELQRFGIPPEASRPELIERVLVKVVEPCARAVLSGNWSAAGASAPTGSAQRPT